MIKSLIGRTDLMVMLGGLYITQFLLFYYYDAGLQALNRIRLRKIKEGEIYGG
jgi:hypothetical protein